jgi:hypothetical protein
LYAHMNKIKIKKTKQKKPTTKIREGTGEELSK